jgi:hypothetical protein
MTKSFEWHACEKKVAYETAAKARKAVKRLSKGLRFYECQFCGMFHLTSRADSTAEQRQRKFHGG